ncbi:hypothetical protein PCK1_000281 [Pneumocystis canis]|nr:hypothetical protein PCK1_000281 [Pneumocystis canis]
MYWPIGIPAVFQVKNNSLTGLEYTSITSEEPILAFKKLFGGTHFIVLTTKRIYIWQNRPTVVVSCITRSAISLTLYGENRDIFLKPDSQLVCVKTSLGFLVIYSVHSNMNQKLYKFHYSQFKSSVFDFLDLYGSTEYELLYLKFKTMIKIDAGLLCILSLDDFILFSTSNPPSVQFLHWYKESNHTMTTLGHLVQMDWIEDNDVVINDMIYDKNMNIYIWVTSNSKAYLVRGNPSVKLKNQENFGNWTGICFYVPESEEQHIAKLDMNMQLSLIVFGCRNGEIKLFYYKKLENSISYLHAISLDSFDITGSIECISWSEDGYAIFVGFQNTWALWTVYGNLLCSGITSECVFEDSTEEIFMIGVSHVLWFNGGSELIIISNKEKSFGKLWKLNIARCIQRFSYNLENSSNFILQISDQLLIYKGYEKSDIDIINPKESHWEQIQIPLNYFYDNCYIKYTAISACGQYLAITGYHGIACYSFQAKRWKIIFKDANSYFQVLGGMCWYHYTLIASTKVNDTYGLKLFSWKNTIDDIRVLSSVDIGNPIYLVTLISENLLLYTQNNLILQYLVTMNGNKVKLILVGSVSLMGIICSPKSLRAFTWCFLTNKMQDGNFINNIHMADIILLVDDKLMFLTPNKNNNLSSKYQVYLFSEKVEYFLFIDHLSEYMKSSIWAFCGTEIKIWIDFSDIITENTHSYSDHDDFLGLKSEENLIIIPLDFYFIFPLLSKGMILGIRYDIIQQKNLDYCSFKINTVTKPVLPYILEKYLYRTKVEDSVALASKYKTLVYFNHMLELLLRNVLEKEANCSKNSNDLLLPKVVSFLTYFPEMLDIVVACIRKMEVCFWKYFFDIACSPRDLFEDCMKLGKFETAAEYLIILHTMEGSADINKDIMKILENAIRLKKWKLCKELIRFFISYSNEELGLKTSISSYFDIKDLLLDIKE